MAIFKKMKDEVEDRCGNCGSYLNPEDKYCRYCGTQRGKGKFSPELNARDVECVYGPPVKTVRRCTACGHRWEMHSLGRDESKYCPQCGSAAIKTVETQLEDF